MDNIFSASPTWQEFIGFNHHSPKIWNPIRGCRCLQEGRPCETPCGKPYYTHLGEYYERTGKAIECNEEGSMPDPDNFYFFKKADELCDEKGIQSKTIPYLTKALQLKPEDPEMLFSLAVTFFGNGKYDEAIKLYEKLLTITTKNQEAAFNLGLCHLKKWHYKKASNAFKKICIQSQNAHELFMFAGNAFKSIDKFEYAIEFYKKSLQAKPDNDLVIKMLGTVFFKSGKFKEAAEFSDMYLKIDPQNFEKLYEAGVSKLRLGKITEAHEYLSKAMKIKKNDADCLNALGEAIMESGNNDDEALKLFYQAAKKNYAHKYASTNIVTLLLKKGDIENAMEHNKNAFICAADDAELMNNCGMIFYNHGEYELADNCFFKLCYTHAEVAEYHFNYARTLMKLGDKKEAYASLKRAVKHDKNYKEKIGNEQVFDPFRQADPEFPDNLNKRKKAASKKK